MASNPTEEKAKQSALSYLRAWGGQYHGAHPDPPPLTSPRITRPSNHPRNAHHIPTCSAATIVTTLVPSRPARQHISKPLLLHHRLRRHHRRLVWLVSAAGAAKKTGVYDPEVWNEGDCEGDDNGCLWD